MNNEPAAWIAKTYYPNGLFEDDLVWSKVDENSIPLYTQDQLEEARKLGMRQERALWN